MILMNEKEKEDFKKEWETTVSKLKNSRVDLSKIVLLPVHAEYKKGEK